MRACLTLIENLEYLKERPVELQWTLALKQLVVLCRVLNKHFDGTKQFLTGHEVSLTIARQKIIVKVPRHVKQHTSDGLRKERTPAHPRVSLIIRVLVVLGQCLFMWVISEVLAAIRTMQEEAVGDDVVEEFGGGIWHCLEQVRYNIQELLQLLSVGRSRAELTRNAHL